MEDLVRGEGRKSWKSRSSRVRSCVPFIVVSRDLT